MPKLNTPVHQLCNTPKKGSSVPFKCHVPSPSDVPKPMNCTELTLCRIPATDCSGQKIDLTVDAIASCTDLEALAATAVQDLTLTGNILGITNGNSVTLPTFLVSTPTLIKDFSASIPTVVVGEDDFLLANPVPTGGGWLLVPGTTDKYIPFYKF